jgi:hypothetical protein
METPPRYRPEIALRIVDREFRQAAVVLDDG